MDQYVWEHAQVLADEILWKMLVYPVLFVTKS